jgi:hypothetical protein
VLQFFKHFGSKARIAKELPPPRFKTIIEPFAGSAAYAVQHATPAHSVLLFDTDERVCIVWDYLIHASAADIMRLPVDHFLAGGDIRDLNLPRAEYLLIQRWLSISGTHSHRLAPCLLADRAGTAGNTWCEMVRARIASQIEQIKHWKIKQAPYDSAPDIEAHWHIDPPYQANAHGFQEYRCEPPDYVKLGAWCRSRRGDITVHEQHGAAWLPFETLKSKHSTNRTTEGERVMAHEVYWTNEKRDRTGTLFLFGASL